MYLLDFFFGGAEKKNQKGGEILKKNSEHSVNIKFHQNRNTTYTIVIRPFICLQSGGETVVETLYFT